MPYTLATLGCYSTPLRNLTFAEKVLHDTPVCHFTPLKGVRALNVNHTAAQTCSYISLHYNYQSGMSITKSHHNYFAVHVLSHACIYIYVQCTFHYVLKDKQMKRKFSNKFSYVLSARTFTHTQ